MGDCPNLPQPRARTIIFPRTDATESLRDRETNVCPRCDFRIGNALRTRFFPVRRRSTTCFVCNGGSRVGDSDRKWIVQTVRYVSEAEAEAEAEILREFSSRAEC